MVVVWVIVGPAFSAVLPSSLVVLQGGVAPETYANSVFFTVLCLFSHFFYV